MLLSWMKLEWNASCLFLLQSDQVPQACKATGTVIQHINFFRALNNCYEKILMNFFLSVILFVCKIHAHLHHLLCNFKQLCYLNGVRILFTNKIYSHIFTCTQTLFYSSENTHYTVCVFETFVWRMVTTFL